MVRVPPFRRGKSGGSRRCDERSKTYPPPYANGLRITLISQPAFQEASSLQDAPAIPTQESTEETRGTQLQLVDWNRLEDLLRWFANGCAKDDSANLIFSSSLHQHHRSQIHRLADQVGLDSFSQGFSRERHCSLYAKGKAPAKAVIDDVTQKRAKLLYLLAKADNMRVSRDECAEMLAEGKLTPELQELWDTDGKEQLEIVRLNQAASRGQLNDLEQAIADNPELVRSGKAEVASTLTPLNCAAAQGHVACLKALLAAGAPIEAVDGFGQTALQASRRFEQMDTEAELRRAGAEDLSEREDSVASQSDLAELIRALPRGHKESPAVDRLQEVEDFEEEAGFNRPVRSSFEELSKIAREIEEEEEEEEAAAEAKAQQQVEEHKATNGVTPIQKKASDKSLNKGRQDSSMTRANSGLVNPLTGAIVFGQAISRRHTDEMAVLNSSVNMDMRRDYEGSPDLRGDPKAATRGSRGAAAMALGRRIMESANNQEARRQQSNRPIEFDGAAREVVTQRKEQADKSTPPKDKTLQNILNPLGQPLSLTSARMNGRFGHVPQNNKQRINAWMESAPEEHSSEVNKLTHSVSNPQIHAHEAQAIARAGSAPENESEFIGDQDFDIKEGNEDLYNEIDALGSRPATEKNMRTRPSVEYADLPADAKSPVRSGD